MTVIIRPVISKKKRIPMFASNNGIQDKERKGIAMSNSNLINTAKEEQPVCKMSFSLRERDFGYSIWPRLDRIMEYFGYHMGADADYYGEQPLDDLDIAELTEKLEEENILPQLALWTSEGDGRTTDLLSDYVDLQNHLEMGCNYLGEYPEDF